MGLKNAAGNYLKVKLADSRLPRIVAYDLYESEDVRRAGPGKFDNIHTGVVPCEPLLTAELNKVPVLAEGQTLADAIVAAEYAALKQTSEFANWEDC